MSFTNEVNIPITADPTQAQAEIDALQRNTDKLTSNWAIAKRKIESEMVNIVGAMRSAITLVKNIFNAVGISLNPVQTAIIAAIETSLMAVLAIHRLMEAGTGGIAAAVTIGLTALSVGLAAAAIVLAEQGFQEAQAQMKKAEAVANSAFALFQNLQGIG